MSPRFAALLTAAALTATSAFAQPRAGQSPSETPPGPAPAFQTGAADWACHDGRCVYALAAGAPSQGWTRCTTSWFPTHGGWRKQNICH